MNRGPVFVALAALGAAVCLFSGGVALKWYIWDIAISEAGQPNRSMLYWGLPIVFTGICALGLGVTLAIGAWRAHLAIKDDDPT